MCLPILCKCKGKCQKDQPEQSESEDDSSDSGSERWHGWTLAIQDKRSSIQ